MNKKIIISVLLILCFALNIIKVKAELLAEGSYKIGDKITYNDIEFYVIADSDENSDAVTMLKAEPLTVDEVNKYGVGHLNRYTSYSPGTANNNNGYGGMAYYSSATCGYAEPGNHSSYVTTGCTTDYAQSEVKYAIDAWAADKFKSADLKVDSTGYSARLITREELLNNLGYNHADKGDTSYSLNAEYTPNWVYNNKYHYWTMSQYEDDLLSIWGIIMRGDISKLEEIQSFAVRPVVTLKKIVNNSNKDNNEIVDESDDQESNMKVNVPDTLKNNIILFSIIGGILIICGILITYIVLNSRRKYKNNGRD